MVEADEGEGEESPEDEGVCEAGERALRDDFRLAEDLPEEVPDAAAEGVKGKVRVFFRAEDVAEDGAEAPEEESRGGEDAQDDGGLTRARRSAPARRVWPRDAVPVVEKELFPSNQRVPTAATPTPATIRTCPQVTSSEDSTRSFEQSSEASEVQLVADELVGAAAQTKTDQKKRHGKQACDAVPIEHGVRPARREREVLTSPNRHEGADDEALKADHQEELAATAALVQEFDLIGGQVPFFDGQQCVRHDCLTYLLRVVPVQEGPAARGRWLQLPLNHSLPSPMDSQSRRDKVFVQQAEA